MGGNGNAFNDLISSIAATVMSIAGAVDGILVTFMVLVGIVEPQWQVCFLLIFVSLMVMLVMRTLGGLFGWLALLFAAVLLLHYAVPALGQQS